VTHWPVYAADNSGRTLLEDYLVENIVDFQIELHYLDSAGVATNMIVPAGATVNLTSNGFEPGRYL